MSEQIKFTAYPQVERYYNPNSSYGVYTFYTHTELPHAQQYFPTEMDTNFDDPSKPIYMGILSGKMQQLYIGTEYTVKAEAVFNRKYNTWQYQPSTIVSMCPKTIKQQRQFLSSIVTSKQAESILSAYPNIIEDVIHNQDHVDVNRIYGIGEPTWQKIRVKIIDHYVISDILVLLQPLGVSFAMINKLAQSDPDPQHLKAQILQNPYLLTKIHGLGFAKVDSIAIKLTPEIIHSSKRAIAFIKWYLNSIGEQNGHTWVYTSKFMKDAKESIPECMDLLPELIQKETERDVWLHGDGERFGLCALYNAEIGTYQILCGLCKIQNNWKLDFQAGIEQAQKQQGFSYTSEQLTVLSRALKQNVVILSGKAGTGKTSITRGLLNVYKNAGKFVSCCALSAKAAQRITEATGYKAYTIHRLLCVDPNTESQFRYNHSNPMPCDVLFLDEASMVNAELFYSLISAVKEDSRVILCGDDQQLPPIGAGNIFHDLLSQNKTLPVEHLTKVLRQAQDSGILSDANQIREGINPIGSSAPKITTGKLQDMVYMFRNDRQALQTIALKTYFRSIAQDGIDHVVIITPRKQKCQNSSDELNRLIAQELFTQKSKTEFVPNIDVYGSIYFVGAKVMQIVNDSCKNVYNGEIGYISNIQQDPENKSQKIITVIYTMNGESKQVEYKQNELSQISLAYAMTCHKCQGSGYKTVIVIIDTSHYIMLDSCLLYTAITRAKSRCLLLADPQAYLKCIRTNKSAVRQTWLNLLQQQY